MAKWQKFFGWPVVGVCVVDLVLAVSNTALTAHNRSVSMEVNQRQEFINQTAGFARIREDLARRLATASVNNGDSKLKELLAENGITFTVNAAPPTGGKAGTSTSRPNAKQKG